MMSDIGRECNNYDGDRVTHKSTLTVSGQIDDKREKTFERLII